MATRRNKKLRSLLQQAGLPKPPGNFTREVMHEIDALARDEVYTNATLKGMLQRHVPVTPPADFTYKVLNRARHPQPAPAYPPVIGKKVWAAAGVFVLIYIITAVVMGLTGAAHTNVSYTSPITSHTTRLITNFHEPLLYLGLITFTVCLLLALDHFLKKRLRAGHMA